MKTQAITLADETRELLINFADERDRAISWIVEEALWAYPAFVRYAREREVERPARGKPGRPPSE